MASLLAVATGDWNVAGTWSPAQIPATGDTVNPDTFTVTIPAGITGTCLDLQIAASGTIILAAGAELDIDDALSATINIASGGALQCSGTTASPCVIRSAAAGNPTNFIQFTCDGAVDMDVTTFTGFEVAGWNGTMTLNDSDLQMELSGTTPIAVALTGTITMVRSSLRARDTTKTWYWNTTAAAKITMDKGSDFGTAMKWTLRGTTTSVVLTDTPMEIEETYPPRVVVHGDLVGASTARATKMGMGARTVEVVGSILSANLDEWSVLNDMKESLTETSFKFVWDRGCLDICKILGMPRRRRAGDVDEIFYTMQLVEVVS